MSETTRDVVVRRADKAARVVLALIGGFFVALWVLGMIGDEGKSFFDLTFLFWLNLGAYLFFRGITGAKSLTSSVLGVGLGAFMVGGMFKLVLSSDLIPALRVNSPLFWPAVFSAAFALVVLVTGGVLVSNSLGNLKEKFCKE